MNINNKILTIIIPTYNMEDYLDKTLRSLIIEPQKMEQLEIIVVNDGSQDKSSEIAHQYQYLYPNTIKVIDKENGNYGSCINKGLLEAKGKYIKILDADDSFDNKNFSNYMNIISNLNVDIILNDVQLTTPQNKILKLWSLTVPKLIEYNFFSKNIFPEMHMVAYKTENLKKINYHQTEGISYTDQEWVFTPINTVQSAYYIPLTLYIYLQGREGQTMNPKIRLKHLNDRILIIKNMLYALTHNKYSYQSYNWSKAKFFENFSSLYKSNIIDLHKTNNQLIEFDLFLKNNYPDIYKESEQYLVLNKRYRYNYGKYWRKHYKLNYYNPIIIIYFFIKKIKAIYKSNHI